MVAWLDGYYDALEAARPGEPGELFRWVDRGSAVDFVLLQELVRNTDAYYLSVYLWRDGEAPMRFTPWDLDLSLGQPSYNDNENPRASSPTGRTSSRASGTTPPSARRWRSAGSSCGSGRWPTRRSTPGSTATW